MEGYSVIGEFEYGFGKAYRARSKKSSQLVTIFEFPHKDPQTALEFKNRIMPALKLRHPYILRTTSCILDGLKVFVVAEPIDGESLSRKLARDESIDQFTAMRWFREALIATEFANSCGMKHGNIDCDLIFITHDETLKIFGFEIYKKIGDDKSMIIDLFSPILGVEIFSKLNQRDLVRSLAIEMHSIKPRVQDQISEKLKQIKTKPVRRTEKIKQLHDKLPEKLPVFALTSIVICLAIFITGFIYGKSPHYQHIKATSIQFPDSKPLKIESQDNPLNVDSDKPYIEDDTDFYIDKARMLEKIDDKPAALKTVKTALRDKPGNKKLITELERLAK